MLGPDPLHHRPDPGDSSLEEILDANDGEASVAAVTEVALAKVMGLSGRERAQAILEAVAGATGARLERRTMNGRDLVNLSTEEHGPIVARWTPERERLAAERRKARGPGRPLDS